MKREEKNAQTRRKILEGALQEFSEKGYEGASLNTVCSKNGLSKGIIYHYFNDKDDLYLLCVGECFGALTAYLRREAGALSGTAEERLRAYFDVRLRFFTDYPLFLGIFTDAALNPPAHLAEEIARHRNSFDEWNIAMLTALLEGETLRKGLSVSVIAEDFRMYMDFFNSRFQTALRGGQAPAAVLKEHEERCHRQLDILLHGVLGGRDA